MSLSDVLTTLLGPSPVAILIALVVSVSIPIFLHIYLHQSPTRSSLPSFLITGPSGAGKTALITLLERGKAAETYTSQVPLTVEVSLPVHLKANSNQYRSVNDPSLQSHKKLLLIDTPGHGKLRHHALDHVVSPRNLKGILFVVDSANLTPDSAGLREAAEYLHDVLLVLQKRNAATKTSRAPSELPVLVGANKLDLFTALPAEMVKRVLENEITKVRASRSRGLLDSGIEMTESEKGDEDDWLGAYGESNFNFAQMAEANVDVSVLGGSTTTSDRDQALKWWQWIASNL